MVNQWTIITKWQNNPKYFDLSNNMRSNNQMNEQSFKVVWFVKNFRNKIFKESKNNGCITSSSNLNLLFSTHFPTYFLVKTNKKLSVFLCILWNSLTILFFIHKFSIVNLTSLKKETLSLKRLNTDWQNFLLLKETNLEMIIILKTLKGYYG